MYEYQDKKVEKQLEYDKFLQKYQVELAVVYTFPLGIFFSLISFVGFEKIVRLPITMGSPLPYIVGIFIISLLLFILILNKTKNDMKNIKNYLIRLELKILENKGIEKPKKKRKK